MKIKTKNPLSNIRFHIPSIFHNVGREAYTDWAVSFFFSLALTIFLVVIAYFAYGGTSILGSAKTETKITHRTFFDEKKLEKVLSTYDSRSAERKDIEAGYSGQGDPSF